MEYKSPEGEKFFTQNWSGWLPSGVTITSSTWSSESGLTLSNETNDGTTCTAKATGGVAGKVYEVINTVVASNTETETEAWYLTVQKSIN